jgi:hypothetical protein
MNARRTSALLASAALAVPVLAGCGGGGSNVDVGPAAAVPADAPIYVDATVRPTGSAESGAKAALGKILNTNDPGAKLISQLESSAAQDGKPFNYQQDVAPWLGKQAGLFFKTFGTNPDGAAVVETTNPNSALNFARQQEGVTGTSGISTYNGVSFQTSQTDPSTVFGVVDNFLVLGSEAGFKAAVDASKGDSLGDSGDFKDSIDNLPSNNLGIAYTTPKTLLDALPNLPAQQKSTIESSAGDAIDQPVVGNLTATADAINLDLSSGANGSATPQSPLLENLPQQAWLAVGLSDLGGAIKKGFEQAQSQGIPGVDLSQVRSQIQSATGASLDELTAALGDAALFVQGNSQQTLSGALVVQTKNTELTGRLLNQLQSLLEAGASGGRQVKPLNLSGGTGFQLVSPADFPQPLEFAEQGDKLAIGYGANSATEALQGGGQTLSSNSSFSAAKGQLSSLGVDFFLSLPTVFQLAENSGANKDPGFQQAKQYIDALDYVAEGSGKDGDQAKLKFVVGLK